MLKHFTLSVLAILLASLCILPGRAVAASPVYAPPAQYYMSLGDSLGFGYSQAKFAAVSAANGGVPVASFFNTGYTDDFAKMLSAIRPGIQVVNFSCPGETTASMTAACTSYPAPLHVTYTGAQLDAAVAFLKAHPGQVSPITISIGANDVVQMVQACGGIANLSCVAAKLPPTLQTMGTNLAKIVLTLRAADPTGEIIVNQPYNPFGAVDPTTNVFVPALHNAMAQAAAGGGAVLVDWFTAMNVNRASDICTLVYFCSNGDIHATDAGFLVMAQADWDASGYNFLLHGFMTSFASASSGNGQVLFGSGPGCLGLVQTATRDLGAGTPLHIIPVTGNDLPGTVGDIGIQAGSTYSYAFVNVASSGAVMMNNGGKCYSVKAASAFPPAS